MKTQSRKSSPVASISTIAAAIVEQQSHDAHVDAFASRNVDADVGVMLADMAERGLLPTERDDSAPHDALVSVTPADALAHVAPADAHVDAYHEHNVAEGFFSLSAPVATENAFEFDCPPRTIPLAIASNLKNITSAKDCIRQLLSVDGVALTLEELCDASGKSAVNIRTMLSDLRSAKYAGKDGVFVTKSTRVGGVTRYSKA